MNSRQRKHLNLTGLALLSCLALTLQAATVEMEWRSPDKYRDIESGAESPQRFQERVLTALGTYFENAAASTLPDNQTLHLVITDVDLAGDVEYFFLSFPLGIRVMRDIYFPSIEFTYTLVDDQGRLLRSGEENIKDMGYLFSGMHYIHNPPFDYEKRMIEDWFRRNFEQEISQ